MIPEQMLELLCLLRLGDELNKNNDYLNYDVDKINNRINQLAFEFLKEYTKD